MARTSDCAPSIKAIVLAGGGGMRLWPFSRVDYPKQFLHFGDGQSMLQKTILRIAQSPQVDQILIATSVHYEALVRSQLSHLSLTVPMRILVEPMRKNTAPALAFAVKTLQEEEQLEGQTPFLVLPSDHWIEPESIFLHSIEQVLPAVEQGKIITFGIRPSKPETGYGYLIMGKNFDPFTYLVEAFIEKPSLQKAKQLIGNPAAYWNSGIFMFSLQTFWEEMISWAPAIGRFSGIARQKMFEQFAEMPEISVDCAIMEKSKQLVLCPLPVTWSDVGSWDSVYDLFAKDENQNVKTGRVVDYDTKNSLIFSGKRLIATIGLENVLVVETDDVTLIVKKGHSQKVKEIVERLLQAEEKIGGGARKP